MHKFIRLKWRFLLRSQSSSSQGSILAENEPEMTQWITKQSGQCIIRQVVKVYFSFAQLQGQFVKGQCQIGPYDSISNYLLFQLRKTKVNEHANVGFPNVILFNSVAYNSIKRQLLWFTETFESACF